MFRVRGSSFKEEWSQIIGTIRSLNSTATVKVLNLFNPYRSEEALFSVADGYIRQVNSEFANYSSYYTLVNVYSAFSGTFDDGTFKVSTYTHFSEPTRDPHPTDTGHQFIAQLHQ